MECIVLYQEPQRLSGAGRLNLRIFLNSDFAAVLAAAREGVENEAQSQQSDEHVDVVE